MPLTVLGVAYPLAPVSPDTSGGAEQVLASLDAALVAAGHRSIVVAQEGSRVAGTLVPLPRPAGLLDHAATTDAQAHGRAAIADALARWPVDVVHLHGIDFDAYLPEPGPPVLATLHLPPSWYADTALRSGRPDTWLHCVSAAQHRDCPDLPNLLPPIPNGVDVAALQAPYRKRDFALVLGRICPEKGVHLAIDAAKAADIDLIVAGEVFAYGAHLEYFRQEIVPRLDRRRRYVGPVGFAKKRRLLTQARCLLLPALAPETSSLVLREALACGTPVIAFPAGALPEAIDEGQTGFLVRDPSAMARAIRAAPSLDPERCRAVARQRFSRDRMTAAYLDLYRRLAGRSKDRRSA